MTAGGRAAKSDWKPRDHGVGGKDSAESSSMVGVSRGIVGILELLTLLVPPRGLLQLLDHWCI